LYGVLHDGLWYHISTPDDLESARARFANGHVPAVPFF
jgi:MurNAc alpha-1-phosphate uridylyltransferase